MYKLTKTETILTDDYPVFAGYIYIADNQFIRSTVIGTVGQLKAFLGVVQIRRCDLYAHPGVKVGDFVYSEFHKI